MAVAAAIGCGLLPAAAPAAPLRVQEVQSLSGGDIGAARPTSLAFSARDGLIIGQSVRGRTTLRRFDVARERRRGSVRLRALARPSTLTFDAAGGRVLALSGRELLLAPAAGGPVRRTALRALGVRDPRGAAFDAATSTLYLLDARGNALVRTTITAAGAGTPQRIRLQGAGAQRLRALALNPADGLLYTLSPDRARLLGFATDGTLEHRASLRALGLKSPQALAFAPSADPTDHPRTTHLYIADRGGRARRGRVVETALSTTVARMAATTVQGRLVQTIHTSGYSPGSPDPSGIAYQPERDRFTISDSEVDEMTQYEGVNLWSATRTGSGTGTGTTWAFSREPTGLGYDPATQTLYVSDDDADRVTIDRAGPDGAYGTADDTWSRFSVSGQGITDPEGIEFDTTDGRLWFCDGVGKEIYSIHPVNGVFGDAGDQRTNFDIARYGARDCEGLGIDSARNLLIALDPSTKSLYELTKAGALVRVIDMRGLPVTNKSYAGVTMAPTSSTADDPSALSYWVVDRQVDNGADPNENDGKLYEVSDRATDALPAVSLTEPAAGATVSGTVTLRATASDDVGVSAVQFSVDGVVVGTDSSAADGWSAAWNSATVPDGTHTVTATAQDTRGQTRSDSRTVTVQNASPDTTAPAVSVTAPAAGATLAGTTALAADASDDTAVASVSFLVDGSTVGTDGDGADGWSVAWNTTTVANGAHTVTAIATDAAGNSATSGSVGFTVSNASLPIDVSVPVRVGADDADETISDGAVRRSNGDFELGSEQTGLATVAAARFAAVPVPAGATISAAHVQFTADEIGKPATQLTIAGEAADNSAAFTSTAFNLSGRAQTAARVAWEPPQWLAVPAAGAGERTPELRSIVQEIVGRPGWASSNALTLLFRGTGRRTAESYEGGAPPVLRLQYTG